MIDNNDSEATQDNNTLFSEIQLSGDIDEPSSSGTPLDTDFRLSRLRRSTIIDRRTSSNLPIRSNSFADIEKVIKIIFNKGQVSIRAFFCPKQFSKRVTYSESASNSE